MSKEPFTRKGYSKPGLVSNVTKLLTMPCATPPLVYVETAIPALLKLFSSIAHPSFKAAYHQALGRTMHHTVFEVANEVLQDDPILESGGFKFLYRLTADLDILTRDLWLADLAYEGLFNWTSQIIRYSCPNGPGNKHIGSSNSPYGACFDDSWDGYAFDWVNNQAGSNFGPAFSPQVTVPEGASAFVFCAASGKDLTGQPYPLGLRLIRTDTGDILQEDQSDPEHNGTNDTAFIGGRYKNPTGGAYTLAMHAKALTPQPDGEGFPGDGYCVLYAYDSATGRPIAPAG